MQIGYNNDVDFEGVTYHIQTEDHGLADGRITSLVFREGAIVDTISVSYLKHIQDIEDADERDEAIRKRMRALHKVCYRNIKSGKYVAPTPSEAEAVEHPTQLGEPTAASQAEMFAGPLPAHLATDPEHPLAATLPLGEDIHISALLEEAVPIDESELHEVGEPTDRMQAVTQAAEAADLTPLAAVLGGQRATLPDIAAAGALSAKALPPPVPSADLTAGPEPTPDTVGGFKVAGVQNEMDPALIAAHSRGEPLEEIEELDIEDLPESGLMPIADEGGELHVVIDIQTHPDVRAFRGLDVDPDRELTTLIELWSRRLGEAQ